MLSVSRMVVGVGNRTKNKTDNGIHPHKGWRPAEEGH